MQTRRQAALRTAWRFLTVIPGWQDAGRIARFFYVLPLALPFVALLLLFAWDRLVRRPQIEHVRAACAEARQLEAEIETLRLEWSDEQARELEAAGDRLRESLLRTSSEVGTLSADMRALALTQGWNAVLYENEPEQDTGEQAGPAVVFRTVRGRLTPTPQNPAPFATLRKLLDGLVPPDRHGALTRLSVRADEPGNLSVELGVRFAALPLDEKAP